LVGRARFELATNGFLWIGFAHCSNHVDKSVSDKDPSASAMKGLYKSSIEQVSSQ
jgi:hypothetical protein